MKKKNVQRKVTERSRYRIKILYVCLNKSIAVIPIRKLSHWEDWVINDTVQGEKKVVKVCTDKAEPVCIGVSAYEEAIRTPGRYYVTEAWRTVYGEEKR